jgi:hypothetical protein
MMLGFVITTLLAKRTLAGVENVVLVTRATNKKNVEERRKLSK